MVHRQSQAGFSVEVTNTDATTVMVGVRVLVGTQDVQRAPTYVELFGRTVAMVLQRHRWFDIPLTKEESLQVPVSFIIFFFFFFVFLVFFFKLSAFLPLSSN